VEISWKGIEIQSISTQLLIGGGKTLIHVLEGPDGPTTNKSEMLEIASDYYQDMFKFDDDSFDEGDKVKME
jgi:hypothetical protein